MNHRFVFAITLCAAASAFAAEPEALAPDADQLYAAICQVASIPGPHGLGRQFEIGALIAGDDRLEGAGKAARKTLTLAPRHGWVTITTDEASLRLSVADFARELERALREQPSSRFPAPCVVRGAMESVVVTAIVRTASGFIGVAAFEHVVRVTPAAEPDEKKAKLATMKLASTLARARLKPMLISDLSHQQRRSGASSGWAEAADAQ